MILVCTYLATLGTLCVVARFGRSVGDYEGWPTSGDGAVQATVALTVDQTDKSGKCVALVTFEKWRKCSRMCLLSVLATMQDTHDSFACVLLAGMPHQRLVACNHAGLGKTGAGQQVGSYQEAAVCRLPPDRQGDARRSPLAGQSLSVTCRNAGSIMPKLFTFKTASCMQHWQGV
jgi:hypothetical protein